MRILVRSRRKRNTKNVVKEYKQKHPDSASHVNQQVQAGKKLYEKLRWR